MLIYKGIMLNICTPHLKPQKEVFMNRKLPDTLRSGRCKSWLLEDAIPRAASDEQFGVIVGGPPWLNSTTRGNSKNFYAQTKLQNFKIHNSWERGGMRGQYMT
jgi:hypothetical protein